MRLEVRSAIKWLIGIDMIESRLIRENIEYIRDILKKRNMENVVDLDQLKRIDEERRENIA